MSLSISSPPSSMFAYRAALQPPSTDELVAQFDAEGGLSIDEAGEAGGFLGESAVEFDLDGDAFAGEVGMKPGVSQPSLSGADPISLFEGLVAGADAPEAAPVFGFRTLLDSIR